MPPKKGKRKGGGTGTAQRRQHGTYEAEDAHLDVAADSGVSLGLFCGGDVRLDEMLGTAVNAVVPDFLQFIQGHFDQLNETKPGGTRAVPKTPARSDFRKDKAMVNKFNEFDLNSIKVETEEEEDESNSGDNLGSSRNRVRPFTLDSDEDEEQSTNPERSGPAAARNIFEESDDYQDIPQSSTLFTATRASASLKANPSAKVNKNYSPPVSVPDLATPNMTNGSRVKNEPFSAAVEAASSAPSPRRLRTRTPAAAHSPGRFFTATPSNASTRGSLDVQLNMDSEGDDDEIHPRNTRAQAQKASQKEKPETRSQKKKPKPAAAAQRGNATPRKKTEREKATLRKMTEREKATLRNMTEREQRVNKREEEKKKRQEQRRQKIEADLAAAEQTRKQEMQERAERARREREEKQKRVQLKKEEQEKERREMLEKRQKLAEMAEAIRERNRQNSPRRAASKSPARGFRAAGMNSPFSSQRCASKSPASTRSLGWATPYRGVQNGAASAGRAQPQLGSIFNNKRTAVPSSPATPKSRAINFFGETDSEKEDEKELGLAREKKIKEEEKRQEQRRQKIEADLATAEQTRKQEMQERAERARREREEKQKRVQLKKEEQEKERREMLEKRQKLAEMAEAIRERNRQNSPRRAASKSPARGFRAAGMNAPFSPQRCASKSPARTRCPGQATPSRGVQDGAASAWTARPQFSCCCSFFNNKAVQVPAKQSRFGQSPRLARNFFDEADSEKEDEKELREFREAGMNAPFSPQRCASKSPARTRCPGQATPSRGVQDGAASAGTARPQFSCCCSFFNNKRTAVPSSPATPKVQSRFGQSPSLARNFFDEADSEKEDENEHRLAREKKRGEEERERSQIRKMEAAELEKQTIIETQKERERKEEERLKREVENKEKERMERALREKQEKEREQRQMEEEEINKHLLNESMDENVTATSSYDITPDKVYQPSSATNYNINDLSSGDETDDENEPRKRVPLWARSEALQAACKVMRVANLEEDALFGQTESPNLPTIFKYSGRYNKRTSSAKWDSPISNPSKGVSRYFAAIPPKK